MTLNTHERNKSIKDLKPIFCALDERFSHKTILIELSNLNKATRDTDSIGAD
jgi:hypothetical protein